MKSYRSIFHFIIVLSIVIILFSISPISKALADTAGPNDPGSGTNQVGIGTEVWQSPDNITSSGSPYATVTLYQGHLQSNYLQGTNYNFAIPPEATIAGIEVQINRRSDSRNPNVIDTEVRLVKGGQIVGDNRALPNSWPTTLTVATYGGPTDLWGLTWLPADINSIDFGVVLAAHRDNNGNNQRQALVDSMQITVYYEISPNMTVVCGDGTPVVYGDSVDCIATVTSPSGSQTPSGTVNWTSDSGGVFELNPCTLAGADGVSTCTTTYTPDAVGSGTHEVTGSYNGDTFFTPSSASDIVTVVQRPITVTTDPQTKTFGDPDPLLTYQITYGTLVSGDNFSGALLREPGEDVGDYAILQGNLTLSVNYNLTYVGDFLTIIKATPKCLVDGFTGVYDGSPHGASGSCTGVNGEALAVLDLGAAFTNVPGGTAEWVFNDENGNYKDASGSVDIVLSKADPSCLVTGFTGVYDGSAHKASGSCSGIGGENPGTLDVGESFTNVPGGTAHWMLTGNGNYNNSSGDAAIVITKAEAVCIVTPYSVEYDRLSHTATGSCTGVVGETLTGLDLTETAHTQIGIYTSDPWTFVDAGGNYNDANGSVTDQITVRKITVAADALSKGIGQPDPVLTYQITSGSLLAGDNFNGALLRLTGEKPGTYPILQGSLSLPSYYDITYVPAVFTITGWITYLIFIHK
jgi:MBG domain (YGX type)/Bacterial Ig-like domain (group 3)